MKEKLSNLVLFDKATYDKMLSDVPKLKLITPSIISEKLKVNGSLARRALRELEQKGLIRARTTAEPPSPGLPTRPAAAPPGLSSPSTPPRRPDPQAQAPAGLHTSDQPMIARGRHRGTGVPPGW